MDRVQMYGESNVDTYITMFKQMLLLLLSRFSRVQLCVTPQTAAHQASRPWDSPGKNTGVGCHFLLQGMKVKNESEVVQLCLTLCDPMVYTVHGILQAITLEWVAFPFSRGSSQPRDRTQVSHIAGRFCTS